MKRLMCILLVLTALLSGCASSASQGSAPVAESTGTNEATTTEKTDVDVSVLPEANITLPVTIPENQIGNILQLNNPGAERVPYTHNVSNVRYITSAANLPDYTALAGYDDTFFQKHALLVVLQSVSSGSTQVSIDSVCDGAVTLSYQTSGNVGTTVMTTWLLWAEVDPELDYSWYVANPALQQSTTPS